MGSQIEASGAPFVAPLNEYHKSNVAFDALYVAKAEQTQSAEKSALGTATKFPTPPKNTPILGSNSLYLIIKKQPTGRNILKTALKG